MSDLTNGQTSARNNWQSPFQFEPSNYGLGIAFTVTTSSQSAALVGQGFTIDVSNDGSVSAHLAFGNATAPAVATAAHTLLLPGTTQCFTLRPEDQITEVAVITRSGTTYVQITRGNGG